MTRIPRDRDDADENHFAYEAEIRVIARRRAIEALATWASRAMALSGERASRYEVGLMDSFISGISEDRILAQVRSDLARAGKSMFSRTAVTFHGQALALATDALHGRIAPQAQAGQPVTIPVR